MLRRDVGELRPLTIQGAAHERTHLAVELVPELRQAQTPSSFDDEPVKSGVRLHSCSVSFSDSASVM